MKIIDYYFYGDSLSLPRYKENLFLEDITFWTFIKLKNPKIRFESQKINQEFGNNLNNLNFVLENTLKAPCFHFSKEKLKWLFTNFNKQSFYLDSQVKRTTTNLISDIQMKIKYNIKIKNLVVHVGINDCVPRLLSLKMRKIISRLPFFLREKIIKLLHKLRPQMLNLNYKFRHERTWVPLSIFNKNLIKLKKICEHNKINLKFVNISPPNDFLENRSIGCSENIQDFNNCIKNILGKESMVDMNSIANKNLNQIMLSDGHHLSRKGHKELAVKINSLI